MRKGIVTGLAVVLVFLFVSVACAVNLVVWSSPDNADALHELAQNFMAKTPMCRLR